MIFIMALAFLGPAIPPDPRMIGAPLLVLAHAEFPVWARTVVAAAFLVLVAAVFSGMRPFVLGGTFRGYIDCLPLPSKLKQSVDQRVAARAGLIFLVPIICAWWSLPESIRRYGHQTEYLVVLMSATATLISLVWLAARMAIENNGLKALCLVVLAAFAVLCGNLSASLHVAMLLIISIVAIYVAQSARRLNFRLSVGDWKPATFHFRRGSAGLLWRTPIVMLWRGAKASTQMKLALVALIFGLVATGILRFDMQEHWRGLTASAMGIGLWLLASLYDPLVEMRAPIRILRALPFRKGWHVLSDMAGLVILAFPLFAVLAAVLAASGFLAAVTLAIFALAALALFRLFQFLPAAWNVPLQPPVAIAWIVLTTYAL
jgi:hypothetical protein